MTLLETFQQEHVLFCGAPAARPAPEDSCQAEVLLEDLARRLGIFHARYHDLFVTRTKSVVEPSGKYLFGLIQSERKNMERMAEVVPDIDDQVYQHFMTNSPWSHRAVLDRIARDADAVLGGSEDSFLLIDESAMSKKGKQSVGVARQWNGRLGKIDNCQVGVFAALGCGDEATLIDSRLYLSKEWVNDPERCDRARIPVGERVPRSKAQLALEMIHQAHSQGLRYRWIGMDSGYGKEPWLLRKLDRERETWVADVHCDQRIYLEDPCPVVPKRRKATGRGPSRRVAQVPAIRVDRWAAAQSEGEWKRVVLRESTKGTLTVEVLHRRVWVWDGKESKAPCWYLIVRREIESPQEIKYSLSNAPETTTTERLAYQQGQRYWIEQSLRNGKSEVGMADYQLRQWTGWHHHMAMVLLAMLFMLEVRREHKQELPLLSCHDLVEVLRVLLPRSNVSYKDIIEQLKERHRRRQASIDAAYAKQRAKEQCRGP